MFVKVEQTNDQPITIEQALSVMENARGMVDGFPVHDGRDVYCEIVEFKDHHEWLNAQA